MHKFPIGVLGGSGHAGRELCALVERHPALDLVFATAHEQCGARVRVGSRELTFCAPDTVSLGDAALVLSALPHGTSAPWVERARHAGAKVVDLSADLRPGAGVTAVPYGLTELTRRAVQGADVVANPGCYPTAVLLALLPLLSRGLVDPAGTIVVSAASGVTGAGAAPRADLMFSEVTEDLRAYAVDNTHRHVAEMRAVLSGLRCDADLVFTPHLLPVARGILATLTIPVRESIADPLDMWLSHYAGEPFIEVVSEPPRLRDVIRRNVARITVRVAASVRRPTLIVLAAIDNLVKGAAGQALQNGNLLLGLDEPLGLPA